MEGILEAGLEVSFMKLNISVTQNSRLQWMEHQLLYEPHLNKSLSE